MLPVFIALVLALAPGALAGSAFASSDDAVLRMGVGARRLSARIVERPLAFPEGVVRGPSPPTPFEHSAGYFALNRTSAAEMFYFLFRSRAPASDSSPVVLWMTGGPGCSSEIALFGENGPYVVNADAATLRVSEFGWDAVSNLVYVDQPIGTGFSYSTDPADDVHDEKRVADDMLQFLSEFADTHPEFAGRDFFVTGESYAGHYVPAVAYRVFREQQLGNGPTFTLRGLAIGNGLTMPEIQYGAYADYALGMDLVSEEAASNARALVPECQAKIARCGGSAGPVGPAGESAKKRALCTDAVAFCQQIPGMLLDAAGDVNVYDVRKPCVVPGLCYNFSAVASFLNLPSTRAALGVARPETPSWRSCDDKVHADMMADWMRDLEPVIPPMLEAGVRVMVYAGEDDFICNWVGNRRWVRAMPWSGAAAFVATRAEPFVVDGVTGGEVIEAGALAFVKMSQSGHMVPMDQPKNALAMLDRFVRGVPIAGEPWTGRGCCGSGFGDEGGDEAGRKITLGGKTTSSEPRRAAPR